MLHSQFFLNPVEAFVLDFLCQTGLSCLHDASVDEDVHHVGAYVVEKSLVVCYDDGGCLRLAQFVEACGYDAQGVYVETGVRLVEDAEGGFEHSHLEYLVAFLLSAGESLVDGSVHEFLVYLDELAFLLHHLDELGGLDGFFAACLASCVDGRLHEVCHGDSWYLHGQLEGHEYSSVCALLWFHGEEVLSVEGDGAFSHFVSWVTDDDLAECGLSGSVGAHDGVDLSVAYGEVNAFKYFLVANLGVQIVYL